MSLFRRFALLFPIVCCLGGAPVAGQTMPPGRFIDIAATNTAAAAGAPTPFFTESATDAGFTSGPLWRRRPGFGFTVTGAREIYEKDANGGIGDAATLATTVTGLTPGQSYGVYVAFLSVPGESWRVKAGLSSSALELFTPTAPAARITDLGLSGESGSNRRQYLGFVGNASADAEGRLILYSDDGDGTAANYSTRSWLEGFLVAAPYTPPPPPPLPGGATQIAPDGAWTWFNDERAIVHQGSLFSGYVLADGRYGVTRYDFADGKAYHSIISTAASQQKDDHNNPSLTVLPDGRILALYSKHIAGNQYYQRTSLVPRPASDADWGAEIVRPTPAANTYANTYRLSDEGNAIYNFHRCINFNPTLTISTDGGASWGTSRQLVGTGGGSTRPYPRYVSNNRDRIDWIYTDGHPRDVNNSVYHLYYRNGALHKTDGTPIDSLANIPLDHDAGERGSVLYQYRADAWGAGQGPNDWIPTGRGWTWDIAYDREQSPVAVFQVQRDDVTGTGWNHDRIYYYYATWTGTEWRRRFIAQAGRPLYSAEDDYGGGMCLDPEDPRVVYISSNAANPFALGDTQNVPLRANERYELWRGFTADGGLSFTWTQLTVDSAADNLRPIVPPAHGRTECLVWFHGTYTTYTNYSTQVIGRLGAPATSYVSWVADHELGAAIGGEDDPDFDGVPNLLEYAMGGGPANATSAPRLAFDGATLAFPLERARPDAELVVQRSEDLAAWETVATIRTPGLPTIFSPGYGLTLPEASGETRLSIPAAELAARTFFRLGAEAVR